MRAAVGAMWLRSAAVCRPCCAVCASVPECAGQGALVAADTRTLRGEVRVRV